MSNIQEEQKESMREIYPTERLALVIGNSEYAEIDGEKKYGDLPHCVNDATDVAELLEKKLNF